MAFSIFSSWNFLLFIAGIKTTLFNNLILKKVFVFKKKSNLSKFMKKKNCIRFWFENLSKQTPKIIQWKKKKIIKFTDLVFVSIKYIVI